MVIQELPVRLTEEQRNIIREAGLRYFGVIPHRFESHLNDTVQSEASISKCLAPLDKRMPLPLLKLQHRR